MDCKVAKCRSCKNEFEPLYHNGIKVSNFCIKCLSIKGRDKIKKQASIEKKTAKEKLKTHSDLQNDLQIEINKLVRLIDYGNPCIATGRLTGKMNAGHYNSVGSNNSIRFNLHNIFIQSEYSNTYCHGDRAKYEKGIIDTFGIEYFVYVNSLPSTYKDIKLTREELIEKKKLVLSLIKCHETKILTSSERIDIRHKFNRIIGIYK